MLSTSSRFGRHPSRTMDRCLASSRLPCLEVRFSPPGLFVAGRSWIVTSFDRPSYRVHCVATTTSTPAWMQMLSSRCIYEETPRDLLDLMLPRHLVRSRSNLTSPWFDEECRSVKHDVRRLERRHHFSRDLSDRLAWITALREKHYLFRTKENEFWERAVNAQKSDSKQLWRTVSTVLGKSAGKSTSPPFSPAEFLSFLELKVGTIRSATASAPPPTFTRTDSNLDSFDICRPDEISKIIKASAAKSCDLDPASTFLVKECLDVLLPHLTRLFNVSIQSGCLPLSQKTAMVMPRLKKSGLDPAEIKNYRPILNLPFMSKVIEKLILSQITRYLTANGLFPAFHPVSADITPQRQPYSEFSPTSTLPSIKIRSPSLPSSMSARRLILWTTESFSNVSPLHMDSPVWRTHGWSRTSLAENISFTLAAVTHLHPRFSMTFLGDQY